MSRIIAIATEDLTWRNHLQWSLTVRVFPWSGLELVKVGPHKTFINIECILHIACWVGLVAGSFRSCSGLTPLLTFHDLIAHADKEVFDLFPWFG